MKNNILIILVILLIIVLAGIVCVVAIMNSQSSDVPLFVNNSTNDTNISNGNKNSGSVNGKFFCEKCDMWVLESDSKVHGEKYHQFSCEICGKKVWEDGSHVDGSPYHTAKEYDENDKKHGYNQYAEDNDDSIVTTDTYRYNKDGELTNKQLNPNSDKYAYDQY